jgi:hypothetical protein
MTARTLGIVALFSVAAVLWVMNCSGPRPLVTEVSVARPSDGSSLHRVAAVLRNQAGGAGEVQVTVRLRDRTTGQTVQRQETVSLTGAEVTRLVLPIEAPPGDYAPEVEVQYPPR